MKSRLVPGECSFLFRDIQQNWCSNHHTLRSCSPATSSILCLVQAQRSQRLTRRLEMPEFPNANPTLHISLTRAPAPLSSKTRRWLLER